MINFDPNEYRARLSTALNLRDPAVIGAKPFSAPVAEIENPYDTEEMPVQQPQPQQEQPQGGGMNLGAIAQQAMGAMGGMGGGQGQGGMGSAGGLPNVSAMSEGDGGGAEMGHWEGTPNLGAMTGGAAIDESGAMGQSQPRQGLPIGQNGKIDVGPSELDGDGIDEGAMGKANTIDEVFDAAPASTQNKYMDWWEKSYGSINDKYDRMRGELGEYQKLPKKLSKKQMFVLLLGYGARMASNMRRGSEADPMAASDDAFAFGQDTVMGNQMGEQEHAANLGAIERGRAAELKGLGSRGDAMKASSEINLSDARAEELRRGKPGDRITDEQGLVFEVQPDGNLKQVMKPDGKPLKERLPERTGDSSEFERAKRSYLEAHGYDESGKKLTGAAWKKVEQAANDFARYGSREKENLSANPADVMRKAARERVDAIIRAGQDIFRGMSPEEVADETGRMEQREFERLMRDNLGASGPIGAGRGPRSRAPEKSEAFLRKNPQALADFVADYGYVPEGMEQYVTPEIRAQLEN